MTSVGDKDIFFYEADKPYGFLSNYYASTITVKEQKYPTVEHYYQAAKFIDAEYRQIIISQNTPNKAREVASQKIKGGYKWRTDLNPIIQKYLSLGVRVIPDWEEKKDQIMLIGLQAKFTQNLELQEALLATGNAKLYEDSPRDDYWGVGKSKNGKNKLGQLLMQVRTEIREEKEPVDLVSIKLQETTVDLPHSRCNYITEDKLILVGAVPIKETLPALINSGIKLFLNLDPPAWYKDELPKDIRCIEMKTRSGYPPSIQDAKQALEVVKEYYLKKEKVYIHCNGGHGRAGTMGAYIIGNLFNLTAVQAIQIIETARETRIDKSRNFIPTPETEAQVKFLVKELGIAENETIPDRSDKSWLKRVKKERN